MRDFNDTTILLDLHHKFSESAEGIEVCLVNHGCAGATPTRRVRAAVILVHSNARFLLHFCHTICLLDTHSCDSVQRSQGQQHLLISTDSHPRLNIISLHSHILGFIIKRRVCSGWILLFDSGLQLRPQKLEDSCFLAAFEEPQLSLQISFPENHLCLTTFAFI